ncbi:MAG TPA: 16S rRNA (guanine(527)-N(7))-methyltransferase RsmG [Dehalococcoidia bacterium]|nr:16S rRNA (guanine(527)-N(7))-methyltransferase RsmG [Dehalococcoidia bacterium]
MSGGPSMAVLVAGAQALGLPLSPAQVEAFAVYLDELLRESPAAGLTSIGDPDEVQRRHFLEPLALGRELERLGLLPSGGAVRAIDIGTGGGLPGLPLRIVWPSLRLTLLDAERRKVEFLSRLLERLGLGDVEVVWGRAEEVARHKGHRESYDLALARALAPLPVLAELSLPLLRVGGHLATPKGEKVRREVEEAQRALAECGGQVVHLAPLPLPYEAPTPALLVVRKVAPTPQRYPRRPGIPAKRPLR